MFFSRRILPRWRPGQRPLPDTGFLAAVTTLTAGMIVASAGYNEKEVFSVTPGMLYKS